MSVNPPGPRILTTERKSCHGCPALELQDWTEYFENDETDSGTSAYCAFAKKAIAVYWNERYSVPEFCKLEVVIKKPDAFVDAFEYALDGAVKSVEDYDAYLARQLTDGAKP